MTEPWDGKTERRVSVLHDCDKFCPEHSGTQARMDQFAQDLKVVKEDTQKIPGLSQRVIILIWIFAVIAVGVLSGVVYTFTTTHNFEKNLTIEKKATEDKYETNREADRRILQNFMTEMRQSNNNLQMNMQSQISSLGNKLDGRLDKVEQGLGVLEVKVEANQ